ncbi:MAG: hypothetical protein HY671_13270 [Chloroflexi bacterium]|nr:hypothetical protein [Chloroflexota bacterium]
MEFNAGAAIGAGLAGTAAMTAILYMGVAMMPRQMTMNLLYMLGTMLTRRKGAAYVVGAMMHTMMGIVFALIYAGAFRAFALQSGLIGWGVLFGFVHWVAVGIGIAMVGAVHPMVRSGQMAAPGIFVKNHPPLTVMGFLMLHLLYGLAVGALYGAWA